MTAAPDFWDSRAAGWHVSRWLVRRIDEDYFSWRVTRLQQDLAASRGTRVIDVGCGSGVITAELTKRGLHMVGVDRSSAMLGIARRGAEGAFLHADACALPLLDGTFDAALCLLIIDFVDNPGLLLREVRRVVSPRGRVVVDTFERSVPTMEPLFAKAGLRIVRQFAESELGPGIGIPEWRFVTEPVAT
jgi:ubiquinone/menaquinone biosynthesis C-methylase UbiE